VAEKLGVDAPPKKWTRSEKARTGWSLRSHAPECVLKHLRVSDHPVCGASVASRLFIDAAATPPLQGGAIQIQGRTPNSEVLLIEFGVRP